ncbi:alpha/beta hydrolase [Pseudoalteromonas luteoviolacea]|uniref:alpha/beta hydrolase n=1 Tax=Pseudoalteromonas luteoviolacea TaxID=43657 RepID=UPI00114E01A8|nr:alpha/beta hydrolase [Pseudoalteromonas luteoviolacea]TQF67660.1 alpha/beta hydrolase [Pseudoalteromonas luteoviolacea]
MKYVSHLLGGVALAISTVTNASVFPDPQNLLAHYLSGQPTDGNAPLTASIGYFKEHDQALREMLNNQSPEIERILRGASYCYAAVATKPGAEQLPTLYSQDGQCQQVQAHNATRGWYYTDAQCTTAIEYKNESDTEFCVREFDYKAEKYGNSEDLNYVQDAWMPGYSATLPVTTRPQSFSEVPLVQRATYKTTYSERGACHLEMRVYKNANVHNATPLMMIHGGGWLERLGTARTAEAQIAQFTDAGFVVYMPYYRLVEDREAGPACNQVNIEDSKQDIRDAYLWALFNNYKYTHSNKSIRLTGQSAGGHMSVWLSQQFPFMIEKIAPMFPVPDFAHQLKEVQDGTYVHGYIERMIAILSGKSDWRDLTGNEPVIVNNSLLEYVERYPFLAPDMFISHGMADTIVSPSQSLRLCNALSGDIENGPAQANSLIFTKQYAQIQCRTGSELHLLEKANHHFDGCGLGLCDVGGADGLASTQALIGNMIEWLK